MLRFLSNRRFATLDDFQIPASVLQSTFMPAAAPLPNGGFVMSWMTFTGNNAAITAQIYDRNGRAVGSPIEISPGAAETHTPDIATLSSGGFVVSWTTNGGINGRVYDSAGVAAGPQFSVNTTLGGVQTTSQVAGLAGGGFVITWHDYTNGTFDNIRGQVFAANGTKIGPEFIGGDAVQGLEDYPDLIALSGGGFVVSWFQPNGDSSFGNGVRAQIFDASGHKLGGAFTVNTITAGSQQSAELAALPSGGFVAVWLDDGTTQSANPNNGNQGTWAQLFDASGNKVGANIFVDAVGDNADVEVIPGVGIAIIWKELSDPDSETYANLRIQIFDFSLNRMGEEFVVAPHFQFIQNLPDITALASGGLVVTWLDRGQQDPFGVPHTTILFPTTPGTENADSLSGTANRDFLDGRGGDDQLAGGGEDDGLDGGAGNDFQSGGDGNDTLRGGSGMDWMEGGTGADTFEFDSVGDTRGYVLRSDGKQLRPDVIADFVHGTDKIDLAAIDAIAGTAADDAFTFIGSTAFTHQAGQLRYDASGGQVWLYADLNGDGVADFQIVLLTPVTPTSTDFIL